MPEQNFALDYHYGRYENGEVVVKLIVVPEGKRYDDSAINALTEFQERFFEHIIIR